jgi:uncharacterized protein YfcZ (UPF0381/DUF406 family)
MASNISHCESEEEIAKKTVVVKKRMQKRDRHWTMEKIYSSAKEALEFIDSEKTWSFHYKNKTADGNKSYYRCNKVKLRDAQCPSGIYLLFDCRSEDVFLFRAVENHDHLARSSKSKHGLSDEAKREIEKLYALKLKPKHILAQLREKGFTIKNVSQISNYLKKIKEKISLGQFCIQHKNIPDDKDKDFIATDYDDDDEADDDEDIDASTSSKRNSNRPEKKTRMTKGLD